MKWSYAMVALLLGGSAACSSSSDQAASSSSSGSGGSGTAGAGGTTSSTSSTGEGGSGGGAEGGAGGDGGGGGMLPFNDVPFTVVDFAMPEWVGTSRELVLFQDAASFSSYFGVAPPAQIDWSTEDALLYTEGALPFPGHFATVQALALREDEGELRVDSQLRSPGTGCEVLQWDPPAYQLVKLPAVNAVPQLSEQHMTTSFDCSANGAAQDNSCDEVNLCGPALICGNLTRFSPGLCYSTALHGVFSQRTSVVIPDGSAGGVVSQQTVTGLASVDTDVIVQLELNHPDWSQLTITLTNPDSNEVAVWTQQTPPPGVTTIHRVPVGFSGDESVNGTWSLTVIDGTGGQAGTLQSWDLEIVSRYD